jgi:hypothetical protein
MKILKFTSLFFLLANVFACAAQKSPAPEPDQIMAEVTVKKEGEKTLARIMFYRPISEILNGRENKGFGKSPVVVDFPKINGAPMKEIEAPNVQKMYTAEIEPAAKDYTVTFMRKDGEYRAVVRIDPHDLSKPLNPEFKRTEK